MKMKDGSFVAAFSGFQVRYGEEKIRNVFINLNSLTSLRTKDEENPAVFTYNKPYLQFGKDDVRIKDSSLNAYS